MDPQFLIPSVAGLAAFAVGAAAGLKAWSGWLELKRLELGTRSSPEGPSTFARIELADLKERVRKLEAIAAGVDF